MVRRIEMFILKLVMWITFIALIMIAFDWYHRQTSDNKAWFWIILVSLSVLGFAMDTLIYGASN